MTENELIQQLSESIKRTTDIKKELFPEMGVKRGLRNEDGTGVLVGLTKIGNVIGTKRLPDGSIQSIPGKLYYRGYDVEDLVETLIDQSADCCSVTESLLVSVIDQSAICCSVTETILGDPATASILDIPACLSTSVVDGIINGTDADVMTWLKSIYELVYRINNIFVCGEVDGAIALDLSKKLRGIA